MKALICYWGLVRGFKYAQTLESHKKHIWDVLLGQGIDYDVMLHTYNKEFDNQVLNINNLKYIVVEDDAITGHRLMPKMRNIHMPVYFTDEHKTGLFKCWHSQHHLAERLAFVKDDYDIVITLDIAQYFASSLPYDLVNMDMSKVYLTNFESFNGYNPRFCMSSAENVIFYLSKISYVLQDEDNIPNGMISPEYIDKYAMAYMDHFRVERDKVKEAPNLHPEWQLRHYLNEVGKKDVVELNIRFYRIRENAVLEGLTDEDVQLYKVKVLPE